MSTKVASGILSYSSTNDIVQRSLGGGVGRHVPEVDAGAGADGEPVKPAPWTSIDGDTCVGKVPSADPNTHDPEPSGVRRADPGNSFFGGLIGVGDFLFRSFFGVSPGASRTSWKWWAGSGTERGVLAFDRPLGRFSATAFGKKSFP